MLRGFRTFLAHDRGVTHPPGYPSRGRVGLILGLLGTFLVASCGPDVPSNEAEPPLAESLSERRTAPKTFASVVDDSDREVRLAQRPVRIVSLIPSTTEILLTLGAADRLAARTDYDHDPALAHLPSVGQGLTPSLEWLTAHRADLVIAWPDGQSRSVVERLERLGTPVYGARIETLDDLTSTIQRLGTLLGERARADTLISRIEAELDEVRRVVDGHEPPDILYAAGYDPPGTAGPGTFIHELIEVAGARNVFEDARTPWPMVSLEEIVRRQPDAVIVPVGDGNGASLERMRRASGWRELRAVQEGRVHEVDANLFNRPGPRVGTIARQIAELVHPEAFDPEADP